MLRKILILVAVFFCPPTIAASPTRITTGLKSSTAFAKMYGYGRYFHPSQAAELLDWDQFAAKSYSSLLELSSDDQIIAWLDSQFSKLIIGAKFGRTHSLTCKDTAVDGPHRFWQHYGLLTDYHRNQEQRNIYNSKIVTINPDGSIVGEKLFAEHPQIGETKKIELAKGISVCLPLTAPLLKAPSRGESEKDHKTIEMDSLDSADVQFAATVKVWNIVQHFYPYFDEVKVDWQHQLKQLLKTVVSNSTEEEFIRNLKLAMAAINDGHVYIFRKQSKALGGLPVKFKEIDRRLFVDKSTLSSLQAKDEVLSINGEQPWSLIESRMKLISGSNHRKKYIAVHRGENSISVSGYGEKFDAIIKRNGKKVSIQEKYIYQTLPPEKNKAPFRIIEKGYAYFDLSSLKYDEILKHQEDLFTAKGVIFDLRGYPIDAHKVLQLLSNKNILSGHFLTPKIIHPDHSPLNTFDGSGRWNLPGKKPTSFNAKVVFLTNAKAISYSESVLAIVKEYKLGTIIGQPTAGANGNVNTFIAPGDIQIGFTGMKVRNHDNSQLHTIGVLPDIAYDEDVETWRSGKDGYIDRAMIFFRSGS